MRRDRITRFEVQAWKDRVELPIPFDRSRSFHTKGRFTNEETFTGLIQRGEDIDMLIKKIQQRYLEREKKELSPLMTENMENT